MFDSDIAEITFGDETMKCIVKMWQSNSYYNDFIYTEYSGTLEFNQMLFSKIIPTFEVGKIFGIYYCGKNYSAISESLTSFFNGMFPTCRLTFCNCKMIDDNLSCVAQPNHSGGVSPVSSMSDSEIEDWLGWTKFVQANQRANQLLSQTLEAISEKLPLQSPADDLCALLRGIRPLALFDPEFLSYQPESLILYQNCIKRGYMTRFWKIGNRYMAGIGEDSALREIESVKHEVTTCVKHLIHLFHLTPLQKEEFLIRHEPMGFNVTTRT
jgi:hypothetical protein